VKFCVARPHFGCSVVADLKALDTLLEGISARTPAESTSAVVLGALYIHSV
jgi:hypothetical protein